MPKPSDPKFEGTPGHPHRARDPKRTPLVRPSYKGVRALERAANVRRGDVTYANTLRDADPYSFVQGT